MAATKLGDEALLYAGWIDHWWGPGWVSALSLSNNARPMPQIGIERLETTASSWPVLNLLGPWQAEFFVGLLDGPRLQKNTLYNALRVTFNPAPGLEIGLARTEELCGQDHPCDPLREYFDHSGTSHLFGATIFPDIGHENPLRLTLEYASSISTTDIFSFGDYIYGFSYTSFQYPDGMRYRDRTIGFSLDDDSQLLSLQGSWRDDDGYFYELSLHHAVIGNHHLPQNNIVSPVPVIVNMAEAHVQVPWRHITLDLAGRIQDDQPRPARGFAASIEAARRLYL
jgi:hypothetical protein